jgi:hypothetical protein
MHGTTIDLASNNYNLRVQNKLKLPGGIGLELTYFKFSTFIWGGYYCNRWKPWDGGGP